MPSLSASTVRRIGFAVLLIVAVGISMRMAPLHPPIADEPESPLPVAALPSGSSTSGPVGDLGQPLLSEELNAVPQTIFPDGRNLPPGRGSVAQGATLYAERCAACHGARGIEGPYARLAGSDGFFALSDPLRPLRILKHPILVLSVGAQWPYATSVFDTIRRSMPYPAPKSLTDEQVYALTAHVLHLNGLVAEDAVLDAKTLPQVVMPGLARSTSAWPGGALRQQLASSP